ncbi:hypothetical protein PENSPDRAFT_757068 [Peniophora sp. CONT]|nr:hypothetical protein PENSPDRAFT_757068 [Peniophora sp. CONT]
MFDAYCLFYIFYSVDDEPVSLPRFTIDAVDDLHVGEREKAKRSDLVQGHFAHCRLTAHHLIQNPVPTANGDTAFWRTISNDIKQNVKAWGSDRNTPAWRNWSRALIIEDLAIFPGPTGALQELSQFPGPNANADVAPPVPAPLPIGPPGPLANAMAALPPPQVAPGLWQEIDEAPGGEELDDDAAYDGNNVHLWPQ